MADSNYFWTKQKKLEIRDEATPIGRVYLGSFSREPRGQDFVLVQKDNYRLVFSICDGVSSSFRGYWAAEFLGKKLGEFLWKTDTNNLWKTDESSLASDMTKYLNGLVGDASDTVGKMEIKPDVEGILRTVHEERKTECGSQTVFAAGFADFKKKLLSVWRLGNIGFQAYPSNNWLNHLETPDDCDRWSSKWGVKGEVRCNQGGFPLRFLAYTDGALPIVDELSKGNVVGRFQMLAERARDISEDDLSFFLLETSGNGK